jgi:hypothetical protein
MSGSNLPALTVGASFFTSFFILMISSYYSLLGKTIWKAHQDLAVAGLLTVPQATRRPAVSGFGRVRRPVPSNENPDLGVFRI